MLGMNLNFGTSVIKREARPKAEVEAHLKRKGWSVEGKMGDRISYMSNSGMSITLIEGPSGTVILPSGPLRGSMLGGVDFFSETSVLGAGKNNRNPDKQRPQSSSGDRKTLN